MSFIRPEARQAILRWRESLTGCGVLALGAWWVLSLDGILSWTGYAFCGIGAALIAAGIQRGRFRHTTDGPGLVQIDEGRITYFGPLSGGAVDLAEMTELTLDPSGIPTHWHLSQPGQPPLFIPITAAGSEVLFDAFASLPSLNTEKMLTALSKKTTSPTIIWKRPLKRLH